MLLRLWLVQPVFDFITAVQKTCSAFVLCDITATIIFCTAQLTVFLSRTPQTVGLPLCAVCTFGPYHQQNNTHIVNKTTWLSGAGCVI